MVGMVMGMVVGAVRLRGETQTERSAEYPGYL